MTILTADADATDSDGEQTDQLANSARRERILVWVVGVGAKLDDVVVQIPSGTWRLASAL